jgi:hypothetical protein
MKSSTDVRLTVTVAKISARCGACWGRGTTIPTVPDRSPGMPAGATRSGEPVACGPCQGTGYC